MSILICKYPRSGLANKLLVLIRSFYISKKYSIELYETRFSQLPILSAFINKLNTRTYFDNPIDRSRVPIPFLIRLKIFFNGTKIVNKLQKNYSLELIYLVNTFSNENPYGDISKDHLMIRKYIAKRLNIDIDNNKINSIAIHIRRGDFAIENKSGFSINTRTNIQYFINILSCIDRESIRLSKKFNLLIFTDDPLEVKSLLPDKYREFIISSKDPFADFSALCKSDVIIPNPLSTYSGLASWIGKHKIVIAPKQLHYQFNSMSGNTLIMDPDEINFDILDAIS